MALRPLSRTVRPDSISDRPAIRSMAGQKCCPVGCRGRSDWPAASEPIIVTDRLFSRPPIPGGEGRMQTSEDRISVLIVEDDALLRHFLEHVFVGQDDFVVVG